jgi:hypothetical protein
MKKLPRQSQFQRNRLKHKSWKKKGYKMNDLKTKQVNEVVTENVEGTLPSSPEGLGESQTPQEEETLTL